MKTLEQIKNEYSKTQHYGCWNELLLNNDTFTVGNLHLNNVMKIYAMECLKLASESEFTFSKRESLDSDWIVYVKKESITNENNIIK